MVLRSIVNRVVKPTLVSRIKAIILKSDLLVSLFHLRYFSIDSLDKKLEKYLDFNNGFFVELGANDGVNQSNTLYFERFRGWKGVLIEPFHPNYKELIRNRDSTNFFKNAACVGPTYTNLIVELAYSNLMTSTLGVNSDILDPVNHANQGSRFWGGTTFLFEAPASTLNSILIEANAPTLIDFLSLDVEGVELEILKGVDHENFRFRYICVESRQFDELQTYLLSQEYEYIEKLSSRDYLFKNYRNTVSTLQDNFSYEPISHSQLP
jgi:FkbM family methyltransferase